MDHTKILKRAWHILWSYKVLWIFGIILAFTAVGGGTSSLSYTVGNGDFQEGQFRDFDLDQLRLDLDGSLDNFDEEFEEMLEDIWGDEIRSATVDTIIAIGIGMICFFTLLFVVARVAQYVSETALIRMVDNYEETGERLTFREGFKLGWSRKAWRLFLIDLVINLPALILFGVLLFLALVPLFLLGSEQTSLGVFGIIAAIGFLFVWVLGVIVASAILTLLKRFFRRACALEGLGVIDSIRRGYRVVRANLRDIGVMWLIMVGIDLAWPLVILPVVAIAGLAAVIIGGFVFFLFAALGSILTTGATPWLIAGILAFPAFLVVFGLPVWFVGGLRMTFVSSTWTLSYREVAALERLDPDLLVDVELESKDESGEGESEEEQAE
jgi:hypothetical protein